MLSRPSSGQGQQRRGLSVVTYSQPTAGQPTGCRPVLVADNAPHDDLLIRADKNPQHARPQNPGPAERGGKAEQILSAAGQGKIKVLFVFGVDLVAALGQAAADAALGEATVILLDTDYTDTTEYADLVLPIATAPETDGSCINYAGRIQRLRQAFPPPGEVKTGWEALSLLSTKLGGPDSVSISEVFAELSAAVPAWPDSPMAGSVPTGPCCPPFSPTTREPKHRPRWLPTLLPCHYTSPQSALV